jgi:hypothetical protein
MTNEHERLEREKKSLERELETPISPERRRAVEAALHHIKQKQRDWGRPRG